jgi:hypothetical protein
MEIVEFNEAKMNQAALRFMNAWARLHLVERGPLAPAHKRRKGRSAGMGADVTFKNYPRRPRDHPLTQLSTPASAFPKCLRCTMSPAALRLVVKRAQRECPNEQAHCGAEPLATRW